MAEGIHQICWESKEVVARAVDNASYHDPLSRLESHLKYGVLSERERRKNGVQSKLSLEGWDKMMTAPDEISVYTMPMFRAWAFILKCNLGVFIQTPTSTSANLEVNHPIIKDSVPEKERKIVGVYINPHYVEPNKVISAVRSVLPLPIYDNSLQLVWSPSR